MNLISCDCCGVVVDADKLEFPEIRDDEGVIIDKACILRFGEYHPALDCPVCHAKTIMKETND